MEQSRVEEILAAINDGETEQIVPQSRVEELLLELGEVVGDKMDSNVGSDNAGKFLGIDQDGNIVPASAWGSGVVITENVVTGQDYSLTISEQG